MQIQQYWQDNLSQLKLAQIVLKPKQIDTEKKSNPTIYYITHFGPNGALAFSPFQ